jgi:hypothetical protein
LLGFLYLILIWTLCGVAGWFTARAHAKAISAGPFINQKVIDTVRRLDRIDTAIGLTTLGAPFGLFALVITHHLPTIELIVSNPLFIAPTLAVGILLYRFRSQQPFAYGMIEFGVAIIAAFVSISAPGNAVLPKLLGIMGGIYIMIRGLDNMEKGLPERWRPRWDALFPKHRR